MPKTPHEALHHLFRDDPDLVRRALKECLGEDFPEFRSVAVIDSDLTEIKAVIREVDTALMVETDAGREILIIEPQSQPPDRDKRRAWHWYLSYIEAYYKAPATLIILTAKHPTARECRRPMTLGPERRPSATLHPLVIGPDNTPLITDPLQAADDVMLAVMAALAHRSHPQINTALDVLAGALNGIDHDSAKFFAEYVEVGLGDGSAHDHWKGIIMTMTYPFASELRQELKARGRAEGRLEGRAEMLLKTLSLRGIDITSTQREQVLGCDDGTQFETWLSRALTADTADEVFGPDDE
jgi:hypothetical protein